MSELRSFNFATRVNPARSRRRLTPAIAPLCVVVLMVCADASTAADDVVPTLGIVECGDVYNPALGGADSGGLFDYTNPKDWAEVGAANIPMVNRNHFTPPVETLVKGHSSWDPLDDIHFTLVHVPNHHRALNAVVRYELEKGGIPPRHRSVECWFDRAFRFRPNDGVVWLIYANYKTRKSDWDEALRGYGRAKELMPTNVEVDYNLGLFYVKRGDYPKALEHARVAYGKGYPLRGLKRQLAEKGYDPDAH